MPLLDHFRPPVYPKHAWESFHSWWATSIGGILHQVLPPRYFAEVQVHLGSRVEADVAEFEELETTANGPTNGPGGGVALQAWAPPVATWVLPAVYPDDIEIHILDERDDARLVAVIELVSPGNKDRAETRRAFAAKSAAYLQRGIGLVVLDIVTSRQFNLHNELIDLLGAGGDFAMPAATWLYAVSYHPGRTGNHNRIEVWSAELRVGEPLPLLPLAIRGYRPVPLDVEATYTDARNRSRV